MGNGTKLLEDDIAVVWSTSYLDEAQNCDEVILLNEGNCLSRNSSKFKRKYEK